MEYFIVFLNLGKCVHRATSIRRRFNPPSFFVCVLNGKIFEQALPERASGGTFSPRIVYSPKSGIRVSVMGFSTTKYDECCWITFNTISLFLTSFAQKKVIYR